MVDLYPYSGRSSGSMTDADHEDLWSGWQDGVFPGQPYSACQPAILGGQWVVYPGRFLIAGHVLNIDTAQYGALPTAGGATRTSLICAYINRSTNPWTYGVQLVQGSPGGGRPALSQSRTGLYQVPLRPLQTATNGTNTMQPDERTFLVPAGDPLLRASTAVPSTVPATIIGADGQSTSLLRLQESPTGSFVFAVAQNGHVGVGQTGGASTSIGLWVKADSTGDTTVRLDAINGQTGRILQVRDENGAETVGISQAGSLTIAGNLAAANFDNTSWTDYDPSANNDGSATYSARSGRWKRTATKTVVFSAEWVVGRAGSGTGAFTWHLPTAPRRNIRWSFGGHAENPGAILQAITAQGGSGVTVDATLAVTSAATGNLTGAGLTAGRILTISGTYEEA